MAANKAIRRLRIKPERVATASLEKLYAGSFVVFVQALCLWQASGTHTMQKEARMSPKNSRDRYVRTAVIATTIVLALTVGGEAATHHPIPHNDRDHRGVAPKPISPKGTYNPASATVRDHRTPIGNGASAIPNGGQR